MQASPSDNSGCATDLALARERFADPKVRECKSIRSVWVEYTCEKAGPSIRCVHEANREAWSRKWPKPVFKAWQKWESIIDGVNLYADAITSTTGLARPEAEERALEVLEYQRSSLLKHNLQEFREKKLKKGALMQLRLEGLEALGRRIHADYLALQATSARAVS